MAMGQVFCCNHCFTNEYLRDYIVDNYEMSGKCPYCKSNNSYLISTRILGDYMRDCIRKAYESYDEGTGAYHDEEEKQYCGPDGKEASIYSIREILTQNEMIFSDTALNTSLLEDLFENLYSTREIQKGADDLYSDIDSDNWVVKNDLYGSEQTRIYHAWEGFKFIIKHYNRFFDCDGYNPKEIYLERLLPYIYDFIEEIPEGTVFYRSRLESAEIHKLEDIDSYSQMGPPPAQYATTNRMSPAGIPYLYLASDIDTTLSECRVGEHEKAVTAQYVAKKDIQIIDFSHNRYFAADSIFNPEYDHDERWINGFWRSFVNEISLPVSPDKKDHSYEYAATQLVAEFFRSKGYEGICFNSSVGKGREFEKISVN